MSDIDILVPQTATIKLLGRQCEIKPLSIKSAVQLGRIIGKMHAQIKSADTNIIAAILEHAGARETKEIINIFTANAFADIDDIDEKLTVYDLSLLAKAVAQVNDFETITANFTRALGKAAHSQAR